MTLTMMMPVFLVFVCTVIFFFLGMISPKTAGELTQLLFKRTFNRFQIFLFSVFVIWICGMILYWSGQ